jgi:hypothetical protein
MMKIMIDFNELAHIERNDTFFLHLWRLFSNELRKIVAKTPILPPFRYKNRRFSSVSYKELGQSIRFNNENANKLLEEHRKRLDLHHKLSSVVYYSIAIAFSLFLLVMVGYLSPIFGLGAPGQNVASGIITTISAFLAMRIAVVLVDKHFADTLALISAIYLMVFLEKEENLTAPQTRRKILEKIRILRKNMVLLARTFVNEDDGWLYQHMMKMENFVRERESWVIAPREQTLHDLRRDFSFLLDILASGQYGRFEWNKDECIPEAQKSQHVDGFGTRLVRVLLFWWLRTLI